jgi:hypothetical protein
MDIRFEFETPTLVVLHASGTLKRDAVDAAKRRLHAHLLENGPCRVMIWLHPGSPVIDRSEVWEDIEEDVFIQQNLIRLALLGDLRWRDNALLFLLSGLVPFQMDYFKPEQEPLARAWLLS